MIGELMRELINGEWFWTQLVSHTCHCPVDLTWPSKRVKHKHQCSSNGCCFPRIKRWCIFKPHEETLNWSTRGSVLAGGDCTLGVNHFISWIVNKGKQSLASGWAWPFCRWGKRLICLAIKGIFFFRGPRYLTQLISNFGAPSEERFGLMEIDEKSDYNGCNAHIILLARR